MWNLSSDSLEVMFTDVECKPPARKRWRREMKQTSENKTKPLSRFSLEELNEQLSSIVEVLHLQPPRTTVTMWLLMVTSKRQTEETRMKYQSDVQITRLPLFHCVLEAKTAVEMFCLRLRFNAFQTFLRLWCKQVHRLSPCHTGGVRLAPPPAPPARSPTTELSSRIPPPPPPPPPTPQSGLRNGHLQSLGEWGHVCTSWTSYYY